uniref:Uncharacterized protein n=1 Tax=viral metagenome TaxID=1070528 RepID=A0A6M3IMI9_9ZZZZ
MADKIINHDVRVVNGRTIYMPSYFDAQDGLWGNLKLPDLSVAHTVQQYPLGTRYVDGDRAFRYAKFMGTMNPDLGAKDTQPQTVAYATIAAAALQYATTLVLDVAATDGIAGDGVVAVDSLAGGYCVIFDASSKAITRQIKSNTVVASSGGEMTIIVTDPVPVALIADTDHIECMANPYSYLTASTSNAYGAFMGLPQLVYTTGQFGWLQTWGPTWLAPQAAVGGGSNNRTCIFRHDGSIDELDYSDANNAKGQIAGFVMSHAQAGTQGAPFVWLTIAP